MKNFLLTLTSIMMFSVVSFAQNVNASLYKSRIEKSNADIQDPKKNTKASTWMTRGKAFYDTGVANSFKIFVGMPEADMITAIGNPKNIESLVVEKIGDTDYVKYQYNDVDIYFKNVEKDKVVTFWMETNPIYPNALVESKNAYLKALELDPGSSSKVAEALKKVMQAYINVATNTSIMDKQIESGDNFAAASEIGLMSIVNESKAASWAYYAGVFYAMNGKFDLAVKQLTPIADAGIFEEDGNLYYYLGYSYKNLKNMEMAEKLYLKGVEKFPSNQPMLQDLISLYIETKQDPAKVIPFIKKGQDADPKNPVFFLAEGIAYGTMKDYDKTIAAYEKAIQLNPDFFEALYSIGVVYYDMAVKLSNELNDTDYTQTKLREELQDKIVAIHKKAIVPLEKAHSVNPNDKSTVEYLKSIYFVLRDKGDGMQANYDKYNALFKSM